MVKPGVYKVGTETRLYEVIEMAGGLTSTADADAINRAAFVEDGEKIIVPEKITSEDSSADGFPQESQTPYVSGSGLININLASKDELKTLYGIGDKIADRIIEYRTGTRFRNTEDIKSVKGIGDAIYDKIKDQITV